MSIDIAGIGSLATAAASIVDKFWPDKTELEKAAIASELSVTLGQIDINKIEAASTNWFVAGWRPFISWICGAGLGYQFLFMPLINGVFLAFGAKAVFIALDVSTLMACVSGLLGLAGMRTYEKKAGVESAH